MQFNIHVFQKLGGESYLEFLPLFFLAQVVHSEAIKTLVQHVLPEFADPIHKGYVRKME